MGIIEKQSKFNLLILAIAVFLGAVNNIGLFPVALNKEEWGIIRFLPTISIIASNISLFGTPSILMKFMPSFLKKEGSNNGLFFYAIKIATVGILTVLAIFMLFKSSILGIYEENAGRISDYYNLIIPLFVLTAVTDLLSAFTRAHLLSIYQLFLKEVVHRIVQAILLMLLIFKWVDFELFTTLFSLSLLVNLIGLIYFLSSRKLLDVNPAVIPKENKKAILKFGATSSLTGLGATLTNRIDGLMITALVSGGVIGISNGLEAVAIYSFGLYLISIIDMPARAIANIANNIIAVAWEKNDKKELLLIYQKTSINQLIIGGLLFILIWSGIDELFELIGKYEESKWVILYLGIGKIVNLTFGTNSAIISSSKYYIYLMYAMLVLLVLTVSLNLYFIPLYGIEGAAIATTLTLVSYNLLLLFMIKIKSGMQPFTTKTLISILLAGTLFVFANYIDFNLQPLFEIIVVGSILSILFFVGVYTFKLSIELNNTIDKVIRFIIKKVRS